MDKYIIVALVAVALFVLVGDRGSSANLDPFYAEAEGATAAALVSMRPTPPKVEPIPPAKVAAPAAPAIVQPRTTGGCHTDSRGNTVCPAQKPATTVYRSGRGGLIQRIFGKR